MWCGLAKKALFALKVAIIHKHAALNFANVSPVHILRAGLARLNNRVLNFNLNREISFNSKMYGRWPYQTEIAALWDYGYITSLA